jgi:hypothetical protein
MPCYDPPPPYEGAERKSAQQAVKLLCALVTTHIDHGIPANAELLNWYIAHRKIDIEMARYCQKGDGEIYAAKKDIERAKRLLQEPTK